MRLELTQMLLEQIHRQAEEAYPEEGAGFLLGSEGQPRVVRAILPLPNKREQPTRSTRYLIAPEDYLKAELEAERRMQEVVGVFHSHPDHPNRPSEYDREWAQPHFSYVITSVESGRALGSRSWRLSEDRTQFLEEDIRVSVPE